MKVIEGLTSQEDIGMLKSGSGYVYGDAEFLSCRNSNIVACFKAYFDESGTDTPKRISENRGPRRNEESIPID